MKYFFVLEKSNNLSKTWEKGKETSLTALYCDERGHF